VLIMRSILASLTALLAAAVLAAPLAAQGWTVAPREHVDLWLHGFALVHDDSSAVPLYRRGYRDEVAAIKRAGDVVSDLDANRETLAAGMRSMPGLLGAQFAVLDFANWDDLREGVRLWLETNGDLRRLRTQREFDLAARVGASFRGARERDWLRLFMRGLEDERGKYFDRAWREAQAERSAALRAAEVIWRDSVRPALGPFLGNTQQGGGAIVPSIVLEAEGRTINRSRLDNVIVTGFPARDTAAWDVAYVMVHELVASVAASAVRDHTTPAQQRSGEAEVFNSVAMVRGGAALVEKAMPEQVEGYMRFYLRAAGHQAGTAAWASGAALRTAFANAFPIPSAMLDGMRAQITIIWGGI